jgi:nitroreductase
MDALDAIQTRRTIGRLIEPAPNEAALARAFEAAVAAPDHKRLRPWRFLIITGDARHELGALMAKALKSDKPDASDADLERESGKPLRAPMIIAAVAKIDTGSKIPEVEQVLAAGAATQNLMLALHAQGFGSGWKTGGSSYSPIVREGLGLAGSDKIIGFIYAGSLSAAAPPATPANWRDYVSNWDGPQR